MSISNTAGARHDTHFSLLFLQYHLRRVGVEPEASADTPSHSPAEQGLSTPHYDSDTPTTSPRCPRLNSPAAGTSKVPGAVTWERGRRFFGGPGKAEPPSHPRGRGERGGAVGVQERSVVSGTGRCGSERVGKPPGGQARLGAGCGRGQDGRSSGWDGGQRPC
jgi:hypothetical protein